MKLEIKKFSDMVKENEEYVEQECVYCNPMPIRLFSQESKEYNKKWVSVESEVMKLNNILELVANGDSIRDGEEYATIQKLIINHILELEKKK